MTSRPSRHLIRVKQRTLDRLANAPERVRRIFWETLEILEHGPYPHECAFAAEAKGTGLKHCYVAWRDGVNLLYRITQDQPVIVVVGVHWKSGPDDNGDGEPGPDEWDFSLAA